MAHKGKPWDDNRRGEKNKEFAGKTAGKDGSNEGGQGVESQKKLASATP